MKYWIFKHTYPNAQEENHIKLINTCIDNGFCYSHYEYGFKRPRPMDTTKMWKKFMEVSIGDIIFLLDKNNIYAYGYAKYPRKIENVESIYLSCKNIINKKNHIVNGINYIHNNIKDIIIYFNDCECFYENMCDESIEPYNWKQRIDVDWKFISRDKNGNLLKIRNRGIHGKQGDFTPLKEIDYNYAKKLAIKLTGNVNFEFKENIMEDYKKLLENNYNLILTGAPGTGKTYLAKQIAAKIIFNDDKKEYMEYLEEDDNFRNQCKFVQFHPSYDYTDFVEGLRPVKDINGNIGFERKDGVFKEFCKKALENLIKIESIIIKEYLKKFIEDVSNIIANNEEKFEIDGIGREASALKKIELKDEKLYITPDIKADEPIKLTLDKLIEYYKKFSKGLKINEKWYSKDFIKELEINGKHTYIYGFLKAFYEKYNSEIEKEVNNKKKNFVFIIDEINRGEISKIFGELFFAIDPGYRGIKGKVLTQYSNLIDEESEKYFYIPENVYIIGTMNDIDRSVESMDFAMRRRFAWREVKAEKTQYMLDGILDTAILGEAKKRMNSLNNAISEIEGFNSSYHIGASYFLKLKNYYKSSSDNKDEAFDMLWENHLKGLLSEYLRGMPDASAKLEDLEDVYDGLIDEEDEA